jgi:propanol-preferring alcohol dehydrogenase
MDTYKAVAVPAPNILDIVERPVPTPRTGQVRFRVEACGVCHSDVATVSARRPDLMFPRVPGHEVVGRSDALRPGVSGGRIGQRVSIGFFAGEDGVCESCRRGRKPVSTTRLVSPRKLLAGLPAVVLLSAE